MKIAAILWRSSVVALCSALLGPTALGAAPLGAASGPRPNIILILADDLGWASVDFPQRLSPSAGQTAALTKEGHPKLKTPGLRAMRQSGMQLNRFYAACPVCSPTRASLLTGRHHRRMRIDHANDGHLLNQELTLAEIARSLGYTTGFFGKWHLGTLDKSVHPIDSNRGGTRRPDSARHYSPPWHHGYDTTFATEAKTQTFNPTDISPPTRYWTGHRRSLPLNDPTLAGDDSRVIMDRVLPFIGDSVDAERPFLATIFFHTPHRDYSTIDQQTLDDFYPAAEQAAMNDNERAYYAAITAMDQQISRLREELERLQIAETTLVVFTSDNGPENGVPQIDLQAGGLRGNKRHLYEGGVRVPGLAQWKGRIPAGSQSDAIAGVVDLLPTLMDIWNLQMPDDRPIDGESLLPVLTQAGASRPSSMKFDFGRQRSIVDARGQYKAISDNDGELWELYDLLTDPGERKNLAEHRPLILSALGRQWNGWRNQVDAQRNDHIDYRFSLPQTNDAQLETRHPIRLGSGDRVGTRAVVVLERQFVTLASDLAVESDGTPSRRDHSEPPRASSIDAGTVIDSYLIHFDPGRQAADEASSTRLTVTFASQIAGVFASTEGLRRSDSLAFGHPKFDTSPARGAELGEPGDRWSVRDGGRTIEINLSSSGSEPGQEIDQVRVVTRSLLPGQCSQ